MQKFAVEARRSAESPWMPVLTVQEDLVDEVAAMMPTEPGEWRLRPEDPEPRHPVAPARVTTKITWRDRLRWWAMMRFTRRARR